MLLVTILLECSVESEQWIAKCGGAGTPAIFELGFKCACRNVMQFVKLKIPVWKDRFITH